jgi:hypothetical protein
MPVCVQLADFLIGEHSRIFRPQLVFAHFFKISLQGAAEDRAQAEARRAELRQYRERLNKRLAARPATAAPEIGQTRTVVSQPHWFQSSFESGKQIRTGLSVRYLRT